MWITSYPTDSRLSMGKRRVSIPTTRTISSAFVGAIIPKRHISNAVFCVGILWDLRLICADLYRWNVMRRLWFYGDLRNVLTFPPRLLPSHAERPAISPIPLGLILDHEAPPVWPGRRRKKRDRLGL